MHKVKTLAAKKQNQLYKGQQIFPRRHFALNSKRPELRAHVMQQFSALWMADNGDLPFFCGCANMPLHEGIHHCGYRRNNTEFFHQKTLCSEPCLLGLPSHPTLSAQVFWQDDRPVPIL